MNRRVPLRHLTPKGETVTVAGGTEGSGYTPKEYPPASSAQELPGATAMATALDALAAMYHGYVGKDRELLDSGFETLVEVLEEWRDEIPKVKP